jgi:hypothetical protein
LIIHNFESLENIAYVIATVSNGFTCHTSPPILR